MKINDILRAGTITVSCELFPPKQGSELEGAKTIVHDTAALAPSFISVTYGGGTGDHTVSLADEAQNTCGVTALAHLTCISHDKNSVRKVLSKLKSKELKTF